MSQVVGGIATAHTPLLTVGAEHWLTLALRDRVNPDLYDEAGTHVTYDVLAERAGDRFAGQANLARFELDRARCERGIDALRAHIAAARPDVLVIVGDDQLELFDATNQPAIAVFHGTVANMAHLDLIPPGPMGDELRHNYAMEGGATLPVHQPLAVALCTGLVERGFDLATSAAEPPGKGFGHAFGFISRRLASDDLPIVPVLLNTYYPPNQPSPRRCVQLGEALREAVEAFDADLRVMFVASGGLSHFVVDEDLDGRVLTAIRNDDVEAMSALPVQQLQAGSSEIRNWLTLAGAMRGRPVVHETYVPCVRTEAGTGIGAAFLAWA